MKCIIHNYKQFETEEKCIKCGKSKPLPFFPFGYTVLKLNISCFLWKLRGLQTCPHHGFHAQNYVTGYCKKCKRKKWKKVNGYLP